MEVDPIRRRSLYVRVEHPTPQREAEIIANRTPQANEEFHREMADIALSLRNYSLEKPPSVSEMIDFPCRTDRRYRVRVDLGQVAD
jgi:MoxR-like ATPase